jgi:Ca2+-binding RTX toxin-like protein
LKLSVSGGKILSGGLAMPRFTGTVSDADRGVTFQIKLIKDKNYVVDLRGFGGQGELRDPILVLVGDDGQYVEDNNGWFGKNAQVSFKPDRTQYFDVSVYGDDGSTGGFILDVNPDEFRNGIIGAARAGVATANGQSEKGRINYDGDADIFGVSLVSGLSYSFWMEADRSATNDVADPRLTLLGPRGNKQAEDAQSGPEGEAFFRYTPAKTGEYWLRAQSSGEDTGKYLVRASIGKGSRQDDAVSGSDNRDFINTLGGDDTVFGGAGFDRIWGASGRDTLAGGDGRDSILGGLHGDTIKGGLGSDDLSGEEGGDILRGGEGHDRLEGGDGRDVLAGGNGSDSVFGELDNDRLYGGGRSGFLVGGEGEDRISGGFDHDSIHGESGDDRITGGEGDDFIDGGAENDHMSRGRGNDRIFGDEGEDVLRGGADGDGLEGADGNDVFEFTSPSDSMIDDPDVVFGFDRPGGAEGDQFDLSAIDADRTAPGNQTFAFGAGQGKGAVWLEDDTARFSTATLVFLNIDNDADPEFVLKVEDGQGTKARAYTATDFDL